MDMLREHSTGRIKHPNSKIYFGASSGFIGQFVLSSVDRVMLYFIRQDCITFSKSYKDKLPIFISR